MFSFVEDIKSYFCFSAGSNSISKLEEQIIERSNSLGNIEEIREETCQPLPVVGKTDQGKKLQYNDFLNSFYYIIHLRNKDARIQSLHPAWPRLETNRRFPTFYGKLYSFFHIWGKGLSRVKVLATSSTICVSDYFRKKCCSILNLNWTTINVELLHNICQLA